MSRGIFKGTILLIILLAIINYPNANTQTMQLEQLEETPKHISLKEEIPKEENTYYQIPLPHEIQDYIREMCKENDVDIEIILGIMDTESSFKNTAKSKNNNGSGCSVGIMQLNENHINWYEELTGLGQEFNIHNIQHNILGGILVYKNYRNYWSNMGHKDKRLEQLTLLSYNRGINGAKKYVSRHGYNNSYIDKVRKNKNNIIEEVEEVN